MNDVPVAPARVNDYGSSAEAYPAENDSSLVSAYYARPAMPGSGG
ncbi:hypothetical protein ACFYY8_03090 [Streptosporangium sp. NPDC001559]